MATIKRAVLRYPGGKFQRAQWTIQHMPPHRVYTESYGGGFSVGMQKPRAYAEVYNDLDGEIVNVFRVLRNPMQARELARQVALTPYAREEFDLSHLPDGDPIEQARRTLYRAAAGHASTVTSDRYKTGWRSYCGTGRRASPASDWTNYPDAIPAFVERLRGVYIESLPALDVLVKYDAPHALHYVDPPYVPETRNQRYVGQLYRHEMTPDDHRQLAATLHALKGMVLLAGYASPLYDELYPDWQRVECRAYADGAQERTEVLWLNPAAASRQQVKMNI